VLCCYFFHSKMEIVAMCILQNLFLHTDDQLFIVVLLVLLVLVLLILYKDEQEIRSVLLCNSINIVLLSCQCYIVSLVFFSFTFFIINKNEISSIYFFSSIVSGC